MKTDDIEAFVAVVRCQSLSVAADTLQLTQSAITRRVQNFEDALGSELLDRNTKPLKPTAMGLRVYEQCREVLRAMDVLREIVAHDAIPSGILRLGVPQTVGDIVLLDALEQLKNAYPDLQTQVSNGWGNTLLERLENLELDAVAALFPVGRGFPEGIVGTVLARMKLQVVAARNSWKPRHGRRSSQLADCSERGWVLNPDGCGFRAGLERALLDQGLKLKTNLETFGTDLQMGLVAKNLGLGLIPEPLLQISRYRDELEIVNLGDFKPVVELWLLQPRFVGNLQGAIELFGRLITEHLESSA
ncbi:LysR family transcriptional regulator [Azomonas macrocytogenes]|uniref:DNA-binding transcriptional LysR family regulator n=1 Tax=Azomonas macrocytogenes TaxID=69962 RepID=A0A839SXT3_AZOMA|nr:LysR family transcriptional regulator [Azomonas macrocytogenes]MBB3102171.1 DNA-binding transcriptional LysR family regulator [Azomonas macrocytogenes]